MKYLAALADYEQPQRLGGEDPRPIYNFGLVLMQRGDYVGAIREFDRAAAMAPNDVHVRVRRAQANRMLGNLPAAKLELEEVLKRNPDSADALSELAFVLWNLKDAKGALEVADRVTKLDPQRATEPWIRGLWQASREEWGSAEKSYQAALERDPENASLLNNHAGVLLHLGKPGEALADLDKALALKPDHVLARWNRIRAAIDLGDADEALSDLKALEKPASSSEALGHAEFLASACLKAGRQLPPGKSRAIVEECLARIALLSASRDETFIRRLKETPSIATLARNPATARRIFPEVKSN
ncbi:MAG: tetratricopeptide repeat protein [Planctomycetota bacterium]